MNRKLCCKRLLRSMLMVMFVLICFASYGQVEPDTSKTWMLYQPQQQINQDSIDARQKFVQDSIQAREQFVRDSILRRKQILDSVTFLQGELQILLEAAHRTMKEDIIFHADKIPIIGDSTLGDYVYHKLPLALSEPYCPWKGRLSLAPKHIRFNIDKRTNKISSIKAPSLEISFKYGNQGMILIIQETEVIQNHSIGKFYRIPIDSVFYDRNKRIVKIKRYVQFYNLVNSYQKGEFLFSNLAQVKQYQYGTGNQIVQYELVKFCDRYKAYEPNKVCFIGTYSVTKQGNTYQITRRNNPANLYTDGTFTLEYDGNENIKCLSFKNMENTQNWQRFVEMNKEGNVNCYIEKMQGVIQNTSCMIYHKEPNAKYPVETINTTYEKDGVDYKQINITTGKMRERHRMTLEWGPWR